MPAKAVSLVKRDVSLTLMSRSLVELTRMVANSAASVKLLSLKTHGTARQFSGGFALEAPLGMARKEYTPVSWSINSPHALIFVESMRALTCQERCKDNMKT